MTTPTIVTRAGKGSALTWTEGDANFTNLRDATITVTDGSNSKALNLNDTLTFTAGTNISLSVNSSTGAVTVNNTASSGISVVQDDTNPALGGNLNTNGWKIVSASGDNVVVEPGGTGDVYLIADTVRIGDSATAAVLTTYGAGNLTVSTNSGTNSGTIVINQGVNGNIAITPNGTGSIVLDGMNWPQADGTANYVLKTNGSGQLSWVAQTTAFDPASPGAIGGTTAAAGTFTDLTSTGKLTFKQPIEAIYDLGTTGGTIAPNCVNGSVQKITLSSALTLNAFTSPVAGQSLTLIIYGGTAYTSITSTMKFAGGVKTLTGTASCIDIVSIYYDGTNYFASLGKGFA